MQLTGIVFVLLVRWKTSSVIHRGKSVGKLSCLMAVFATDCPHVFPQFSTLLRLNHDNAFKLLDLLGKARVLVHFRLDDLDAMDDCGVVAPEGGADRL